MYDITPAFLRELFLLYHMHFNVMVALSFVKHGLFQCAFHITAYVICMNTHISVICMNTHIGVHMLSFITSIS